MGKINQPKVVVIVGPTASGKSDLGIKIAQKFNGEIISADSRQVYRGMDIGTGKVTKKEQKLAKHHLIDAVSPKKIFTADDFKKLGQKALIDIASQSRVPIIVGGTGFYIDVLLDRIGVAEVPPNLELREHFERLSVNHLFKMIQNLDSERAKTIESKNKRRLIRALEIIAALGKVPQHNISTSHVEILWLGLKPKDLEKRIKLRLEKRLKHGMLIEVKALRKRGVAWKRLYDLGLEYRWLSLYIRGKINYKEMKSGLLRDVIKYSKRQMTWFKRNKEITWLGNQKQALKLVRDFLA